MNGDEARALGTLRPVSSSTAPKRLSRTLYVANGIELFERFAFYGMYVGLSRYLTNVIGLGDVETGSAMGTMRLVG